MTRVLVDTSVLSDRLLGQWEEQTGSVEWGSTTVTTSVPVLRAKPLTSQNPRRVKNIHALFTVGRLAREGKLTLATSRELKFEDMYGRRPGRFTIGDAFSGVHLGSLEPAVDRSFFGGLLFPSDMGAVALKKFCKVLLSKSFSLSSLPTELVARLPEVTRKSLLDLQRFRSLCDHPSAAKHYPDLFHLWTGEVNGCQFFLTMEQRLPNFCRKTAKLNLLCSPVTPLELLESIGVHDLDPVPISAEQSVGFWDAIR